MYGMDSKLKLGDQPKNFRTIKKIGGFIIHVLKTGLNHRMKKYSILIDS